jgi:hypothetical protein
MKKKNKNIIIIRRAIFLSFDLMAATDNIIRKILNNLENVLSLSLSHQLERGEEACSGVTWGKIGQLSTAVRRSCLKGNPARSQVV